MYQGRSKSGKPPKRFHRTPAAQAFSVGGALSGRPRRVLHPRLPQFPQSVLASLILLVAGLLPQNATGQEAPADPRQQSSNFVRQGDRLLRTGPAPMSMTLTEGEQYEFEVIDEAALPQVSEAPRDTCALAPEQAGNCLGSCCAGLGLGLQGRGSPFLLPLLGRLGCDPSAWWVRAEALVWWIDGYYIPPLVTTSRFGTDRGVAGRLEQPTTTILFGHEDTGASIHAGGRIRLGYWIDPCQGYGLEAAYFGLSQQSSTFHADSTRIAILARPIFNVEPPVIGQDAELVAFPGLVEGEIQVRHQTQLQGFEAFYRQKLCGDCDRRVHWLVGYRYLGLDEELVISDAKRVVAIDTGFQLGTTIEEFDRFATRNEFHGGQVGMITELRRNRWTVEVIGKLAAGSNHSRVAIDGSMTVTVPDPDVATTPNGLLALPSNRGTHTRDVFAVIPELGVTVGYDLTSCLRATVGYTFLFWNGVARPGEQIDLDVNLSQVPPNTLVGPARPEFRWVGSDLWVQGLSAGLHYRF